MTTKDLIPLGQPGNEERDKAVRAKLKGSSSQKRKNAQKLLGIRKAKPENVDKKILALATDPNMSSLEIIKMLEYVKDMDIKPETYIQLINTSIKAHSAIFGNKNLNINLNKDISSAESMHTIYLEVLNEGNEADRKTDPKRSNKKQKR